MEQYKKNGPKIHCLTNPVVMQDTANLLLAAGGSAIMAQAPEEVEEVTSFCQAALLNTGVPDEAKFKACVLAGKRANALGHPVVLDPVGAGASRFRQKGLEQILSQVKVSIIRCNQEEACTLLRMKNKNSNSFGETEMTDPTVALDSTQLHQDLISWGRTLLALGLSASMTLVRGRYSTSSSQ